MSPGDWAHFNLPEARYLSPAQLDNVGRAVITLAREVAVLADRVMVLEEVLEARGVDVRQAVETHQPSEALQNRLDEATGRIAKGVLAALTGADGTA